MRVVWKDSAYNVKTYKPIKYRKIMIYGYINDGIRGWTVDIKGDNNIYKSNYCAMNAIDKHLGGYGQKGCAKRRSYGIEIIGTIDEAEKKTS